VVLFMKGQCAIICAWTLELDSGVCRSVFLHVIFQTAITTRRQVSFLRTISNCH